MRTANHCLGLSFCNLKSISRILFYVIGCLIFVSLTGCKGQHLEGVLNPRGLIAYEERKLFFDTLALMLIVVLPVIVMSFTFVYHYQVSHRVRDYKPNWSHSYFLESLWWGIPCVIIVILAILTWKKTVELDPYRPIAGQTQAPLVVQAIALPWKWIFIYPEQRIATINELVVPVGQQVEFAFTTDNVPMSAFFVPQLGSQIYAMAGMRTKLHLLANEPGVYDGMNTQFNGNGFPEMHFPVRVVQPDQMQAWVDQVKKSTDKLTDAAYIELLKPSIVDQPKYYADASPELFENILKVYMNSYSTAHPRESVANFNNTTIGE